MLVLSRKRDESIIIGDDIEVTVIDVRGDTVRIGVNAPKSVPIFRQEIYEAIQKENIAASKSMTEDLTQVAKALRKSKTKDPSKKPSD